MGRLARTGGRLELKNLKRACADATAVASFACEGVSHSALLRAAVADVRKRAAEFVRMTRLG
jgi:hypothetical protein